MRPDSKFIRRIQKNTGETIFIYSLFQAGDRVLVGLSGGKDSLSLLDLLFAWNARSPVKIEIFAAFIEIKALGHHLDLAALESFCAARKIPFYHRLVRTEIQPEGKKDQCFLCAWHRRKALFDLAEELGCGKLALGHHLDDIVTTLLMNMSHKGIFATMPVKLPLFNGALTIVRPLGRLEEKEIQQYAQVCRLSVQHQDCPYGKSQSRVRIRGILESLAEIEPHAKRNLFRSMSRIRPGYLS